ncbi:hypothetical protein V500_04255 [Pseudogymnoascus sp. VKM F-4518 (FW-2643)]|nr:hypothetical protein V500_04255 [Pseudogymnoascus sp. VKM F-4518 (FW-2643)]
MQPSVAATRRGRAPRETSPPPRGRRLIWPPGLGTRSGCADSPPPPARSGSWAMPRVGRSVAPFSSEAIASRRDDPRPGGGPAAADQGLPRPPTGPRLAPETPAPGTDGASRRAPARIPARTTPRSAGTPSVGGTAAVACSAMSLADRTASVGRSVVGSSAGCAETASGRVRVIGRGGALHSPEETLLYARTRADPLAADSGSVSAAVAIPCVTMRSSGRVIASSDVPYINSNI